MSTVRASRGRYLSRTRSFAADQRGVVAFEMPIVYLFLIVALLLPLGEVAVVGFQFISAWQALRNFGQSIQYSPPPDITNTSSWVSTAIAKADSNYPISSLQVMCGDNHTVCSGGNTASPKYYSYSTTVTLVPWPLMRSVLCTSGVGDGCTYTLTYSERFQ